MSPVCPQCQVSLHHSHPRSRLERMRRQVTGRMPYRCHNGNWRGSRKNITPRALEPREIHRALTDAELERLEPDNVKGERS